MDKTLIQELAPIAIYFLIACAFFLPVLLNLANVFMGSFGAGDMAGALRTPAYLYHNMQKGISDSHTELLNAPFGSDISQYGNFLFFIFFLNIPLMAATSPLIAYNMLIFSAPLLSAIAAYFLTRHFIKSRQACFIAGLIYGFSPYILARTIAAHINLSHGAWLALFVLALFRFNEKKNCLNAIFLAVSLCFVGFFSEYYLFFAAIFTAIFYAHGFWVKRAGLRGKAKKAAKNPAEFIKKQKHYFVAAGIFLLIFMLTIFPLFQTITERSDAALFKSALGGRTNLMNAVYLSAWPHHFITPSAYHPALGQFVAEFLLSTSPGMNLIGVSAFAGFTALALCFYALIRQKQNRAVRFFLFAAAAVFILATGPFMRYAPVFGLTLTIVPAMLALYSHYCGFKKLRNAFAIIFFLLLFFPLLYPLLPSVQGIAADITGMPQLRTYSASEIIGKLEKYDMLPLPMPSFFLFKAVPFFRAYARLAILLMLCIAVLAGFGMQSLLERMEGKRKKSILAIAVSCLILLEAINFPPYMATDVSETPPEYSWLAEQPEGTIVLEYPLGWEPFFGFYQIKHMQPVMNGQFSSKFEQLKEHITDPTQEQALSILAGLGVKYIITHDDYFLGLISDTLPEKKTTIAWMTKDKSIPFAGKLDAEYPGIAGVRLVKEFAHAKVFAITAEPTTFDFEEK